MVSQISCRYILLQIAVRSGKGSLPPIYHCLDNHSEIRIYIQRGIKVGIRAFNPRSRGFYTSNFISISRSSSLMYRMASTVRWSCPNRVTRTTPSRVWDPRALARVDSK